MVNVNAVIMTVTTVTETVAVTVAVTAVATVIAWETETEIDTVTGTASATGMQAVVVRIMDASDTAKTNLARMTLALEEGTRHWTSTSCLFA